MVESGLIGRLTEGAAVLAAREGQDRAVVARHQSKAPCGGACYPCGEPADTFWQIEVRCYGGGLAASSIPGRLACGIAARFSASGREANHGRSSECSCRNVRSRAVRQTRASGALRVTVPQLDQVAWPSDTEQPGHGVRSVMFSLSFCGACRTRTGTRPDQW